MMTTEEKIDIYSIAQDVYEANCDSRFPDEMLEMAKYLYPDINWDEERTNFFNNEVNLMAQ